MMERSRPSELLRSTHFRADLHTVKMPVSCAAYGCTERRNKSNKDVSFHRFPSEKDRPLIRDQWIKAMHREEILENGKRVPWTPTDNHRLCSNHFTQNDYIIHSETQRTLKETAVPSIFPAFPSYMQKKPSLRRKLVRESSENSEDKSITVYPTISQLTTPTFAELRTVSPVPSHSKEEYGPHLASSVPKCAYVSSTKRKCEDCDQGTKKMKYEVKKIQKLEKRNKKLEMEVRKLRARDKRQKNRIKTMKGLLQSLKKEQKLSQDACSLMMHNFSGMSYQLFENELKNSSKDPKGRKYSEDLKRFALTLQYYSPAAYSHLRKTLALPHPSSIRAWSSTVECEPGFHSEVIRWLGGEVQQQKILPECCLMLDAMAIRKETVWDPVKNEFVGCVHYGTATPEDTDTLATEALVFMAVGLSGKWKHPVGYVLVDKMPGGVQAQLIKDCIVHLTKAGLSVKSVVFDGNFANQETARRLGGKISAANMVPSFKNPHNNTDDIYIILDVCHMIKLMRNALAHEKVFRVDKEDGSHEFIRWEYIEKLHQVQQNEVLLLANKLKKKHVEWDKHKMNVRVAAQTFSTSVADALDFLRLDIKHPEFKDSAATSHFIRQVDKLFDILNSKNPLMKGSKSPLTSFNIDDKEEEVTEITTYLLKIKHGVTGNLMRAGRRKTAFLGFYLSSLSILAVAKDLLRRTEKPYKYVLAYKFSQDHLELFFNKIRQRGGWNNNPNVQQFKWILRKILLKNSINATSTGNCEVEDQETHESVFDISWPKRKEIPPVPDHNLDIVDIDTVLQAIEGQTEITNNCLFYISGFVVRKLLERITCEFCRGALLLSPEDPTGKDVDLLDYLPSQALLTKRKQKGGLIYPSLGVLRIIKTTEFFFRQRVITYTSPFAKGPSGITFERRLGLLMEMDVMSTLHDRQELFPTIRSHLFDHEIFAEADHFSKLIRDLAKTYIGIRVKTYGRQYTVSRRSDMSTNRHLLTKQILFSNL